MRKIRDVLRLSAAGFSKRQIAASLGIGPTAAGECLRWAREAGVTWPLPDDLGDAELERRLYPAPAVVAGDWPVAARIATLSIIGAGGCRCPTNCCSACSVAMNCMVATSALKVKNAVFDRRLL